MDRRAILGEAWIHVAMTLQYKSKRFFQYDYVWAVAPYMEHGALRGMLPPACVRYRVIKVVVYQGTSIPSGYKFNFLRFCGR